MKGNLIETNDYSGVMVEYLIKGSEDITINHNQIQFNQGYAVESYAVKNARLSDNIQIGNGNIKKQIKIFNDKVLIMKYML